MAIPQVQADPIYSLPLLNIYGLQCTYVDGNTISISAGQCRDKNDIIDMPVGEPQLNGIVTSAPLLLEATGRGANGLDTGSLIADTLYSILIIGDSSYNKPVASMLTLSNITSIPLLPKGYDSYRVIGFVRTGSGALFEPFIQSGLGSKRYLEYLNPQSLTVTQGVTTYTTLNLQNFIPYLTQNIDKVLFKANIASLSVSGDSVFFSHVPGTYDFYTIYSNSATPGITDQFQITPTVPAGFTTPRIMYKVSSGGANIEINVQGFEFNV